jgi:hypothetical protein
MKTLIKLMEMMDTTRVAVLYAGFVIEVVKKDCLTSSLGCLEILSNAVITRDANVNTKFLFAMIVSLTQNATASAAH